MVDINLLNEGLNLSTLQLQVKIFQELDSTNEEAKRQIIDGNKHDLLIISSRQTAGRGRLTRSWFSPVGGLYFSLVLKPLLGSQFAPLTSFLSGCAVAKGLQSHGIDNIRLKWPNDILVMEDKVAGILNELVTVDPTNPRIIIGIGVNQNIRRNDFPVELIDRSTSVQHILGLETSHESLLCSIINEIDRLIGIVETENSFISILSSWKALSSTLGRNVRIDDGMHVFTGYAEDILDDGSLVVVTETGKETVTMGDVTHLRSD